MTSPQVPELKQGTGGTPELLSPLIYVHFNVMLLLSKE